jgi:hypothetical protein
VHNRPMVSRTGIAPKSNNFSDRLFKVFFKSSFYLCKKVFIFSPRQQMNSYPVRDFSFFSILNFYIPVIHLKVDKTLLGEDKIMYTRLSMS